MLRHFLGNKNLIPFIFLLVCSSNFLYAEDEKAKRTSTQQVGGLLFDVDEGVKIEQGPGGSVYMKSNKEFMQQRLDEIDQKILNLDARLAAIERALESVGKPNEIILPSSAEKDSRKVLVT